MTTLFITHPGQVVAIPGDVGSLPLTIFLDDWPGYPAIRAIITHVGSQSSGNYQFLHTLKEYIYVYVFGERIGDLSIGGLLFAEACELQNNSGVADATNPANGANAASGFEQLSDYYKSHRIAKRGAPLTIMIGVTGMAKYQGFLVSQRLELVDPQQQLGQFSLFFKNLTPEAVRD